MMQLKPPNIAIFLDVVAIYLFIFLFNPIYNSPKFIIEDGFDLELFPIKYEDDSGVVTAVTGYGKVGDVLMRTADGLFDQNVGVFLYCTGACATVMGDRAKNSHVLLSGAGFDAYSNLIAAKCVGDRPERCDTKYTVSITSSGVVVEDISGL